MSCTLRMSFIGGFTVIQTGVRMVHNCTLLGSPTQRLVVALHDEQFSLQVHVPPSCAGPSRIWHTGAAYHPIPQSATVLTVGGTHYNLFKNEEGQIQNVQRTTLLHFGNIVTFDPAFTVAYVHTYIDHVKILQWNL